jgi:HlyD family secretion protein
MNAKRILIGVLLAIVVLALGAQLLRPHTAEPTTPPIQNVAKTEESTPAPSTASDQPVITPRAESSSDGKDTLSLLGSVQAGEQATLSVRMPARIAAVAVREGDSVRRGQLLVELDAQDFVAQARTAQAGVAVAQAQLRKAQAGYSAQQTKSDADLATARSGLKQAQVKLQQALLARDAARSANQADLITAQAGVRKAQLGLENAQQTLHGVEELAKVGGVSRDDLEGARTQVRVAQSDLTTAQAQVRQLEAGPKPGPGGVSYRIALAQQDVDAAQAGVAQAQEGVRTAEEARRQTLALAQQDIRAARAGQEQALAGASGAQSAVDAALLRSPISGVAANVAARVGETAQPGMPLVTVVSLTGLHAEALVPARQLPRLHVGQAARISVDTLPGRSFSAVVSEIARVAEPDGRTFRVKFRFQNPRLTLRPNQTAHITLSTRT